MEKNMNRKTSAQQDLNRAKYLIRSLSEGGSELCGNAAAFWSNKDGWGSLETATRFTTHERMDSFLPISAGGDAEWIPIADALAGPRNTASAQAEEWPHGATVKLVFVYGSGAHGDTGWAKRDEEGRLVSTYSLLPLDPSQWSVVEDRNLLTYEVTAAGFDGATDATDDRVFWIHAGSPKVVQDAIAGTGAVFHGAIDVHADVDYYLPNDRDKLRSKLSSFLPADENFHH